MRFDPGPISSRVAPGAPLPVRPRSRNTGLLTRMALEGAFIVLVILALAVMQEPARVILLGAIGAWLGVILVVEVLLARLHARVARGRRRSWRPPAARPDVVALRLPHPPAARRPAAPPEQEPVDAVTGPDDVWVVPQEVLIAEPVLEDFAPSEAGRRRARSGGHARDGRRGGRGRAGGRREEAVDAREVEEAEAAARADAEAKAEPRSRPRRRSRRLAPSPCRGCARRRSRGGRARVSRSTRGPRTRRGDGPEPAAEPEAPSRRLDAGNRGPEPAAEPDAGAVDDSDRPGAEPEAPSRSLRRSPTAVDRRPYAFVARRRRLGCARGRRRRRRVGRAGAARARAGGHRRRPGRPDRGGRDAFAGRRPPTPSRPSPRPERPTLGRLARGAALDRQLGAALRAGAGRRGAVGASLALRPSARPSPPPGAASSPRRTPSSARSAQPLPPVLIDPLADGNGSGKRRSRRRRG